MHHCEDVLDLYQQLTWTDGFDMQMQICLKAFVLLLMRQTKTCL